MTEERVQRRLATILAADVVGYSRLMGQDEEATLSTLKSYRDVIDGLITSHGGRVFGSAGDSVIAEFASPVEAVRSAKEIHLAIEKRNTELVETRRMRFRIGINLGDVMIERDNLLGDGVNIAARLEELADPGGICISGAVHEQVRDRVDLPFEDLGEQEVKNIDRPIHVWWWSMDGRAPVGVRAKTDTPLPLPDKLSIAVLPFDNMSGDPEQEYFSDGITEDIITALSKFHWFFVIARNSSFAYKGKAVDVTQVARDLGVRYVLEGSVRKEGARVRITAQLIDATTGNHTWAERYDRDLSDIFAVQDEITDTIVGTLEPELSHFEREQARRKPPENIHAWDHFQRGLWHFYQFTDDKNDRARQEFRRAIDSDPDFSQAYAALANVHVLDVVYASTQFRERSSSEALVAAKKAVALDDRDSFAHHVLGRARLLNRQYDEAVAEIETAIALNPNFAQTYQAMAWALNATGKHEEAIAFCKKGIELSPHDPYMWGFLTMLSWAHLMLRQYEEAVRWTSKAVRLPRAVFWARATHISALGHMGRTKEAQASLDELLQQMPHFSSALVKEGLDYWKMPEQIDMFVDGLRKAGVPET